MEAEAEAAAVDVELPLAAVGCKEIESYKEIVV